LPQALVVDASVARSCGDETAVAAESVACRDVLNAIRNSSLFLVLSPAITVEWIEHRSRYSVKWLSDMVDRRLVLQVDPPPRLAVRNAIAAIGDAGIRELLTKDLLLVEAALATGDRVISRDRQVRQHLHALSSSVVELRNIHWVNPEDVVCILWLRAGAPNNQVLKLTQP
jgi:hypothetical protein